MRALQFLVVLSLSLLVFGAGSASADWEFAKIDGKVSKKAVITKHGAVVYKRDAGPEEKTRADFMSVYFIIDDGEEHGTRVPVSKSGHKPKPLGYLERGDFIEWNTRSLVDFSDPTGREPVRVYDSASCAKEFGGSGGDGAGCEALGVEPTRPLAAGKRKVRMLVPVYQAAGEGERQVFQGGFVSVAGGEAAGGGWGDAAPAPAAGSGSDGGQAPDGDVVGINVLFVVDSTGSMGQWFRPTAAALGDFVANLAKASGDVQVEERVRTGVLFYRDRGGDSSYLTKWGQTLTANAGAVADAFRKENDGGGGDAPEAVYDALFKALHDTEWNEGWLRVIVLVGDAPAHEGTDERNPMGYARDTIVQLAAEKKVRILALHVAGDDDGTLGRQAEGQFKAFAAGAGPSTAGRFATVSKVGDLASYERTLSDTLGKEWAIVRKAERFVGADVAVDPTRPPAGVSDYEWPIILSLKRHAGADEGLPEHAPGWAPKAVKGASALEEHFFMNKGAVRKLAGLLESIVGQWESDPSSGGEAFLSGLRSLLASVFAEEPDDMFTSGETLSEVFERRNLLPFRSQTLSFTADEVTTWGPENYERVMSILQEKAGHLREYFEDPDRIVTLGDSMYVFVPRGVFP